MTSERKELQEINARKAHLLDAKRELLKELKDIDNTVKKLTERQTELLVKDQEEQ